MVTARGQIDSDHFTIKLINYFRLTSWLIKGPIRHYRGIEFMNFLFKIPISMQILIIVAIMAIPAAAIITYSGIQDKNRAMTHARMETQNLVEVVASEHKLLVASAQQLLVTLAQLPEINEKDTANTNLFLSRILRLHPNINNIFVADPAGTIWASAAPLTGKVTINDRRYFKNAIATGQLSSGEYQIGRISDKPTLNMGNPYWNSAGKIAGVICVGMTLQNYGMLLNQATIPKGANIVLLDHKGVVFFSATHPDAELGKPFNAALFDKMRLGPDADTSIALGIEGAPSPQEFHISYRKMRLEGERSPYMYIWVGIPVESALAEATARIVRSMSLFTLVLVSALVLAWLVGKRSISDRILLLEKASQNVANGNLDIRVSEIVKGGELGRLGEAFDAMAQQLSSRKTILAKKQRQLEELNLNLEERIAEAVSDLRRKDQMLVQQGRQAAMGEMIGNIAHQWRQPLNSLGLIVQELRLTYGREDFNKDTLDASVKKAMALINHMSGTIEDFRNYFKPDQSKMRFSVKQAIDKTLALVESSLESLSISVELVEIDDVYINGYANEFSQVLLNILLNSRDAFQDRSIDLRRVITIRLFADNQRSVLSIADNAGGIPEDIIDKIFDPYFTTKGPDKGTGIGLYMAKNIIEKNMGGRLTVSNTPDGAVFRIEV